MLELISDISLVQWVFIILGVAIAAPTLFDSNILNKVKSSPADDLENGLTDLVGQWESLYDSCKKEGLDEACSTLDDVFPLLRGKKDS